MKMLIEASVIRLALTGERAGSFRDNEGDSYPVTVRLPLNNTQPVSALDQIYVATRSGAPVALGEITDPQLVAVAPLITRRMSSWMAAVSASVGSGPRRRGW